MGTTIRTWLGATALICASSGWQAFAQTPPPGAVPTPEQLRPAVPEARPAPTLPDAPRVPRELGKPSEEISLDVTAYAVDPSAPAQLRAALPALTAQFVGPKRSYEDIVNAAAAVTRYLQRELGFYLGYAYLPEQSPKDGVVQIAVLEGRLDEVILNWPEGKLPVDRSVVEAYLARLKPGEILRVRDVERIVFLVNDLRGITARFEVKSGRAPGTASLVVTPQGEPRLASRVEVDSFGSRYSGVFRVGALAIVSSPLGRGDGLVLNALTSTTSGLKFGLAGYTLPVGSDGLKLGVTLSAVRYQLDKEELPIDLNGDATTLTTYALYPAIRSRNLNLFTLLSLDQKEFEDRQGGAGLGLVKKVSAVQLAVSGDLRDDLLSGGVSTYELSLVSGKLKFPGRTPLSDNPLDYRLLRFGASRLQNLVDNRLLLYTSIKGQLAFDNLDSTEQFQLGGPDRVRAFAPGEGTGDQGLVATIELRLLPKEEWFGRVARELVFSTFVDFGTVRFRHDPSSALIAQPDFKNSASLSSVGVGAVWDRPRDFAVRAYFSFPASGTAVNDPVEKKPRIYATASKSF